MPRRGDVLEPASHYPTHQNCRRLGDARRPHADRRRRRARLAPLPGILRGEHPQPAHAPGLRPRRGGVSGLVRGQRGAIDHGRAAASRRGLDRAADARACGTDRQAAPGGAAPSVRLAGDRPGDAGEPGRLGARPVACGEGGQDAGAGTGGSARADRQHRDHDARPACATGR